MYMHMHMYMCAFHGWCAVTWDSTGVLTCMATLINDVILCIPQLLATVQTHHTYTSSISGQMIAQCLHLALAKFNPELYTYRSMHICTSCASKLLEVS